MDFALAFVFSTRSCLPVCRSVCLSVFVVCVCLVWSWLSVCVSGLVRLWLVWSGLVASGMVWSVSVCHSWSVCMVWSVCLLTKENSRELSQNLSKPDKEILGISLFFQGSN